MGSPKVFLRYGLLNFEEVLPETELFKTLLFLETSGPGAAFFDCVNEFGAFADFFAICRTAVLVLDTVVFGGPNVFLETTLGNVAAFVDGMDAFGFETPFVFFPLFIAASPLLTNA